MKDSNFGQFDYFFEINKTYFNEELVGDILHDNFPNFHTSGYNDSKGAIAGSIHNGDSEYPIDIQHREYPDETSTVITSSPTYYTSPKLEVEKTQNKSILRVDHMKNGCLVMETFIASKDSSNVSINTVVYDPSIVETLLSDNNIECKNECKKAKLTPEKLGSYGIYPSIEPIQKTINGADLEAYQAYLIELEQITKELDNENEQKRTR